MSEGHSSPWGRITADGTVYVRTPEGERVVGSWLAGTPEEGLAYYERRYSELATEVELLEQRLRAEAGDAHAILTGARTVRASLPTASVVGDLQTLDRRLADVITAAEERVAQQKAARAEASARALEAKRALVEEAEQLAQSSQWKATGDRFRTLVEEWRAIRGVDRRTDNELWKRVAAARDEFTRRRGAHFAALDDQRREAQARKEQLVEEAEQLTGSTDWGPTAARYRALMGEWKAAGRAPKAVDDSLWARFRAAQDAFFARRSESLGERDAGLRDNLKAKEALLAEAEALDPDADLAAAQRRLREIQQRWDAVGHVPRDALGGLEKRMGAVEQRMRGAADARWRRANPESSPLVTRLRESVAKLEARAARARAAGREDEAAEAEQTLATQREWLTQAERTR